MRRKLGSNRETLKLLRSASVWYRADKVITDRKGAVLYWPNWAGNRRQRFKEWIKVSWIRLTNIFRKASTHAPTLSIHESIKEGLFWEGQEKGLTKEQEQEVQNYLAKKYSINLE